jgi:predicted HicB family RNase H-like nuclease
MRKIIRSKIYDTEKAQHIGSWDNGHYSSDFEYCSEDLYRKKSGEFFMYGEGGPLSGYAKRYGNDVGYGERITPLSYEAAQKWAEEHLDTDQYIAIFGEPAEDGSVEALNVRISSARMAKLRQAASREGMSLVALIERLIDNL